MSNEPFEQTRWSLQDLLPAASGPKFEELLAELEKANTDKSPQLDLCFDEPETAGYEAIQENPVIPLLQAISPDELTPRQALEKLYQLKQVMDEHTANN